MQQSPLSNMLGQLVFFALVSGLVGLVFFSPWIPIFLMIAMYLLLDFFNELDTSEANKLKKPKTRKT